MCIKIEIENGMPVRSLFKVYYMDLAREGLSKLSY
jgi:hypothetical protein